MKNDFDRMIDRRGSGCFKYDALKMIYGREDLIPLWVADMDFAIAPAIQEAMQKRLEHGVFGYNLRLPEFYEAVFDWTKKQYAFECQPEWMISSPGIMPAINLAVLQLTQPGDGVLIQTPVYRPFFDAIIAHDRVLVTNPLKYQDGRYEIDFEDFESKIKQCKLFILCSPHNPVGRVWTETELRKMGTLCSQYRVPIISDEIHADLVYDGRKAISIASLEDFADNTICCVSPAKSFNLAGLTSAVVIAKNPILRKPLASIIDKLHLYLGNSFGIAAVIAAYRDSDDWLKELLIYLQGNRDFMKDYIATNLPHIGVVDLESTYLAWLDIRGLNRDDQAVRSLLVNKAGLALEPGLKFGSEGAGFQRLNFACPRSLLSEALQRLKYAIDEELL